MSLNTEPDSTVINSHYGSDAPLVRAASPWERAKLTVAGVEWPWDKPIAFFWGRKTDVTVEVDPDFAKDLRLALVNTGGQTPDVLPQEGWQPLVEGKCIWNITPEQGMSGKGKMLIFCREVNEVWEILWVAVSTNMLNEVHFRLDGQDQDPNRVMTFYRGTTHKLACFPRNGSPMEGTGVKVKWTTHPGELIEDLNPKEGEPQPLVETSANWEIKCGDKDGEVNFDVASEVVDSFAQRFAAVVVAKTP